jgi:hypothetical protein
MLVSEKAMTEGQGFLLTDPREGLAYQCAGALRRLDRRIVAWLPHADAEKRVRHVAMQTMPRDWRERPLNAELGVFTSVLLSMDSCLGTNAPPTEAELVEWESFLQELASRMPQVHPLLALPHSTPTAWVQRLRAPLRKTTVFLVPALFGFRDSGLLDQAFALLDEKPGALGLSVSEAPLRLAFVGDVASLIILAPELERVHGRCVCVAGLQTSLEEFRQAFVRAFKPQSGALEKLAARLSADRLGSGCSLSSSQETTPSDAAAMEDLFPSPLSSLDRSLSQCAAARSRYPDHDLVFPPPRSV